MLIGDELIFLFKTYLHATQYLGGKYFLELNLSNKFSNKQLQIVHQIRWCTLKI
ncbi:hypothetical protein VIBNIENn2_460042 [Vibrio nigripulchritudo ENn2]|nr:hypothetical protein VIBNIBLFn1_700003 [Vibrio nigripulchritudo BLFn1]CCN94928.1 hypothetical protein VIBNIENn2_460042 [Vibrio nigripulchritudo ENn2]CCO40000.1 hypothetical protein VIBNISFn135_210003 [Vibrio nigripulchritudo SFn135]